MATTHYPISTETDDPRFTIGLLADVLEVLAKHGYPKPGAGDTGNIMSGLFRMLYRP